MQAFAHQFAEVVKRNGGQKNLIKSTGLSQASVSRLENGESTPSLDTLEKLCAYLPDNEAGRLLMAALEDMIPESGRNLVEVNLRLAISEEPAKYGVASAIKKLRPGIRAAIEHLAFMSLEDLDFADYIRQTVEYFDPIWASAQVTENYRALESLVRDIKLPMLGEIPAGEPIVTSQREDGKTVTVGGDLVPLNMRSGAYALKVKGKSMERPGHAKHIPSGSTIIVVQREPQIGDVVVGLVDGTESTLKLLAEQDGEKLLCPLNPHPRFRDVIPLEKMEVQGVFHCLA